MWIFLNNAFFSIVEPSQNGSTDLMVRARFQGDIERVFPDVQVTYTTERDYAYRALIDRNTVAEVISNNIKNINYGNFKDSVEETWRHNAYADVWFVMYDEQRKRKSKE